MWKLTLGSGTIELKAFSHSKLGDTFSNDTEYEGVAMGTIVTLVQ
jgi:hypothetical protein